MKTFRTALLLLAFFCAGTLASASPFIFTAIPDDDQTRLIKRFGAVAEYLTKELKVEVKYIPVKSYEASVTAFKNDQVQMAWFGGLSGVQARLAVPGSKAIAQGVEDKEFVSYFIANTSTGLTEGKDLPDAIKGMTFTFGAKGSTSGRLMPEYYLRQHFKQAPEQIFSRIGYSGDHSKTLALVESGAYQVGAMDYTVWNVNVKEGKVDPSKVRIIWRTPKFQDYQFSVRGDVDAKFGAGFTDRLTKALLSMNDPALLAAFPRKGIIPAKNEDYQSIYDVGKIIGLFE